MKKSRLITVLLMIVILLVLMSTLLMACDPEAKKTDDDPSNGNIDNPPPIVIDKPGNNTSTTKVYNAQGALEKIFASVGAPETLVGMDFEVVVDNPDGSKTIISLKGNIRDEYENEIAFAVCKQLADMQERETIFGLYMIKDKMFVDLGPDKAMLYLEDFNFAYIMDIVNGAVDKIPELLGGFDLSSITTIVPMLLPALFETPQATLLEDGGERIEMGVIIKSFLEDIPGLIKRFAGALDLPVELDVIIEYIAGLLPDGTYMLRADFDTNDELTYLGMNIADNATEIANITVDFNLSDEAVETGIPEIDETTLANFSLTNLQFAIDLTVGTNGSDVFDVGKVVNELLGAIGNNELSLPTGLLLVEGGTGIRLAFALDLDLNYHKDPVDRNKIAIELYLLDQYGNIADGEGSRPQVGIYYSNGSVYVNLDNILPNYLQNVNVRIDADLSVLVNALVDMITQAIDGALGTDFDKIINMGATVNGDGTVSIPTQDGLEEILSLASADVLALSSGDGGEFVISVGWANFVKAISDFVKFGDCLVTEGNKIKITIDDNFLKAIDNLAGTNLKDLFSFKESPIPQVIVNLNFFEGGLDSVTVDATVASVLDFEIKIHQFLIGYEDKDLEQRIADGINTENTSYVNSLSGVFDAVLGGIIFQTNFEMTFDKGKYNLAPFIASFGLQEIADIDIIWEFDQPFVMDLTIDMQIALDRNNPSESTFVFELKTGKDGQGIPIAQIPADTVLVGIYGYKNAIYIDLSNFKIMNITLPKLSFDLNFSSLIYNILDDLVAKLLSGMNISGGDLVFNFDLAGLLGLDTTSQSTENADIATAMALATAGSTREATSQETNAITLLIGTDRIAPVVSMSAILAVVNKINGSLISADLAEALGMMEIKVDMKMGRKEGFTFEFSGNLIPMLDADGVSVYYFKDGVQLPTVDDNGNKIFYNKDEYDEKRYNYGEEFYLKFEMGTKNYPVTIGSIPADKKYDFSLKANEFAQYRSDLVQAIMDTVGTGSFELDLTLYTKDNQMDLQAMINTILASVGKRLDVPVTLNLDEWETQVKLLLQWNFDITSSARTAVKLELQYLGKTLIGVYIYRNSLIIDLEGLGLFSAELVNSSIVNNVFSMLSNVINNIDEINLSDIISNLLEQAGLPTLPSAGADDGSSDIATDDSLSTMGEDIEMMDLIKYILQAVGLHNTSIALNFSSTLINTILYELLGINLGIDFTLNGRLDLFGNEFDLDLGVEDIVVNMQLQLNIGGEVNITVDNASIPDWDASSGTMLAKTMLDNLDIGLTLDIANTTADTTANSSVSGYTRIKIWKSTGSSTDKLDGTNSSPLVDKGVIIVGVYSIDAKAFEDSTSGSVKPIAYIELDYNADSNRMRLSICKNVLSVLNVVDIGTYTERIGLGDLDILASLGELFEGLFSTLDGVFSSTSEADAQAIATTARSNELALADGDDDEDLLGAVIGDLDIVQLLSGGITVSLRSNGVFNVDASLDPYIINTLLDGVLSCVFAGGTGHGSIVNLGEMASDMFSQDHLANITWTREDQGAFWDSFSEGIKPLLTEAITSFAGSFVATLAKPQYGDLLNQLRPIVNSILPFSVWNEFNVGLNVIDGTFANLYAIGKDNNQTIFAPDGTEVYQAGKSGRSASYSTEIWIYNMFDAVGSPDHTVGGVSGVVTWGDIPSRIEYNPYAYSSDEAGRDYLIDTHFSKKTASYQNGSEGRIIKSSVNFSLTSFTDEFGNVTNYTANTNVNSMDMSKKGTYVVTASAVFGTAQRSMPITITSLGMGDGIAKIEDFSMHVYDERPDFLTMVMNDGTTRKISMNSVTIANYAPTTYDKNHSVTATVVFPRAGYDQEVVINYLDSSINEVIVGGETIDASVDTPNLIIDLYDYKLTDTSSLSDYVSDIFYFKYKDGKAVGLTINEDWVVTSGEVKFYDRFTEIANNPEKGLITNVGGEAFVVQSTIGSGATLQTVKLRVWIRTKEVNHLIINGLQDTLRIDPYAYYLYKLYEKYVKPIEDYNATVEDYQKREIPAQYAEYVAYKDYNPFPSTASAYYWEEYDDIVDDYDGLPEEVNITWDQADYERMNYSWATDNTYKEGNDLTVRLDNSKYKGNFTWSFETQLIVLRNEISAVYFDEACTLSTLYIDPFDYLLNDGFHNPEQVYPQYAYIEFTNGRILYMPIEWIGTENFEIKDYSSRMTQLQIKIGAKAGALDINGELEQTAYVNVKVRNLVPAGLDMDGSDYRKGTVFYVDPMQVLFYGQNPFPSDVTMVYTDGSSYTLRNVSYVYDGVISMYGGSGTVTYMPSDDPNYWYTIKVEVIDRSATFKSALESIEIDPYKYTTDANGSRVYSGFIDSAYIYQQVATLDYSDIDNIKVVGLKTASTPGTTAYDRYYRYAITYALGGEVQTVEYTDLQFVQFFLEDQSENMANGDTVILSAVVYEYFQVDIDWDLTEINYAIADDYTVKMIAKAVAGDDSYWYDHTLYNKSFKVTATVKAKTVSSVGNNVIADNGEPTYYTDVRISTDSNGKLYVKNLSGEEQLTRKLTRNMAVYFDDGTSGTYECTIDLSLINFENYDVVALTTPVLDSENVSCAYQTKALELVRNEDVYKQGTKVQVTVCSGDIAQLAYVYVVVIFEETK